MNISVSRKRAERFIQIRITPAHAMLQDRLSTLRTFRKQHEQLRVMTGPTKGLMKSGGGGGRGAGGEGVGEKLLEIDMEEEVKVAVSCSRLGV